MLLGYRKISLLNLQNILSYILVVSEVSSSLKPELSPPAKAAGLGSGFRLG